MMMPPPDHDGGQRGRLKADGETLDHVGAVTGDQALAIDNVTGR